MNLHEILTQLREKKQLSQNELARLLGLSLQQIRALESEQYHRLPRQTLIRALEKYERFFRLSEGELRNYLILTATQVQDQKLGEHITLPRRLNYAFIIVLAIIAFLLYQFTSLLLPPKLNLISPRKDQIVTEPELTIKGYIQPRNTLTINGEVVVPSDRGYFEKKALLREGPNDFTFELTNYWKTKSIVKRTVYYTSEIKPIIPNATELNKQSTTSQQIEYPPATPTSRNSISD
jgi:transcriptional regulator with XRE-family HTH domain